MSTRLTDVPVPLQDQAPAVGRVVPATRMRALVFGASGLGMGGALNRRFQQEYEVTSLVAPTYPALLKWAFLLISFRLPKIRWYRRWKHLIEKTPFSFRVMTRRNRRYLMRHSAPYDLILYLGAMSAPGQPLDKPLFVFTDSCRWLSSSNPDDEISHFRSERERKEWLALEGAHYRSARRIFVGSEFVKKALVDVYQVPPSRVVVIGFGAGEAFGERCVKSFDGRTILYIGKGDFERKGGLILLSAFERVRRRIPDAVLHIVGQDDLKSPPGVVSHGLLRDRDRLLALMRSAHVLTLPSLVDRFGIALVEAMACSTPCVASDYGAMPEIVGDAGIIVPRGEVQPLADALEYVLLNPEAARQMGQIGRQRYETRYNWDTIWQVVRSEIEEGMSE